MLVAGNVFLFFLPASPLILANITRNWLFSRNTINCATIHLVVERDVCSCRKSTIRRILSSFANSRDLELSNVVLHVRGQYFVSAKFYLPIDPFETDYLFISFGNRQSQLIAKQRKLAFIAEPRVSWWKCPVTVFPSSPLQKEESRNSCMKGEKYY